MDATQADAERTKPRPSFKTLGHLVMAMKRFENALNPSYDFHDHGKQKAKAGESSPLFGESNSRTGSGRQNSGRTASGKSYTSTTPVAQHHGSKGAILLRSLAKKNEEENEDESETTGIPS